MSKKSISLLTLLVAVVLLAILLSGSKDPSRSGESVAPMPRFVAERTPKIRTTKAPKDDHLAALPEDQATAWQSNAVHGIPSIAESYTGNPRRQLRGLALKWLVTDIVFRSETRNFQRMISRGKWNPSLEQT